MLTGRPPVTWIGFRSASDTTGGDGRVDEMGELAFEPLRLSLLGRQALTPSSGCLDQLADTRTGTGGFRMMGAFGSTLLGGSSWMAPRLSLYGFSRMGSALDAVVGTGVTRFERSDLPSCHEPRHEVTRRGSTRPGTLPNSARADLAVFADASASLPRAAPATPHCPVVRAGRCPYGFFPAAELAKREFELLSHGLVARDDEALALEQVGRAGVADGQRIAARAAHRTRNSCKTSRVISNLVERAPGVAQVKWTVVSSKRLGVAVGLLCLLATSSALAQPVMSTGRPPVTWIGFRSASDTTGGDGRVDEMGELAFEPLRLSLLGRQALTPSSGCLDQLADTRTGTGGFRLMAAFGSNLLGGSSWKAPRLSLYGFSRMGCPLDAVVGTGATLTLPLEKNVAFALSGGAIYLPATNPGTSNPAGAAVDVATLRAGIVVRGSDGNSFNFGVDSLVRGVTFGGMF